MAKGASGIWCWNNYNHIEPESYPKSRAKKAKELINDLKNVGISVKEKELIHEHFAIID